MLRQFTRYVSLNILGMLAFSFYILVDTFFVAQALGSNGIAALNIALPIYGFMGALGLMLGIGGGTKYAGFRAKDDKTAGNAVFSGVFMVGVAVSVVLLLLGLFASVPMAKMFGGRGDTLLPASIYIKVILAFAPCFVLSHILISFIRNDGNPMLCTLAMLTSSFANIILDYIFMFPMKMGMLGAALATGISVLLSLLLSTTHIIRKKNNFHLKILLITFKKTVSALPLGLFAFITDVATGLVMLTFNLQIQKIAGNTGVAAYAIIANIAFIFTSIFNGIAQGIQPLTSQAHAKENQIGLKHIRKYTISLTLALATLFYLITFLFTDTLVGIFNSENDLALLAIAKNGFHIYFIGLFFSSINIVMAAYLSAKSAPRTAFWVSLTRGLLIIIPLALILPKFLAINGIWLSFILAEVFATLIVIAKLMKRDSYTTASAVNITK